MVPEAVGLPSLPSMLGAEVVGYTMPEALGVDPTAPAQAERHFWFRTSGDLATHRPISLPESASQLYQLLVPGRPFLWHIPLSRWQYCASPHWLSAMHSRHLVVGMRVPSGPRVGTTTQLENWMPELAELSAASLLGLSAASVRQSEAAAHWSVMPLVEKEAEPTRTQLDPQALAVPEASTFLTAEMRTSSQTLREVEMSGRRPKLEAPGAQ
mmetsp:Transcript_40194/g.99481  ORF Transcript_40194/g.99481 Transcript_40194/m.99481 type:complete len:212 (+) Transcript_40194:519-1154(+)